jgi:HCOMODA/2-hydroxy-3-carboxy-muconic semialdehyde decarboxylase
MNSSLSTLSAGEAADLVRVAARAIGRAGLSHAYGHCSALLDENSFVVSPAKPMGLVTAQDDPVTVSVRGPLPSGALGEVRLHQQIYRRRADVRGIVRYQSPRIMSLSSLGRTPLARHGFGSYFAPQAPLWNDTRLIRDDGLAAVAADTLGNGRAIVLRGNGAVAVGASLQEACVMAWYLEDAARVELDVLATGLPGLVFDAEEAAARATTQGLIVERMWEWLTAGDPAAGGPAAGGPGTGPPAFSA